jgi:hypothetical protein
MSKRSWRCVAGLLVGASLSVSLGCQTWVGGMTLPSPHYLDDNPDYIAPKPAFPLPRELAAQQAAAGGVAVPAPAANGGGALP